MISIMDNTRFHMCFNRIKFRQRSQLFNVLVRDDENVSVDSANHEHAIFELIETDQQVSGRDRRVDAESSHILVSLRQNGEGTNAKAESQQ